MHSSIARDDIAEARHKQPTGRSRYLLFSTLCSIYIHVYDFLVQHEFALSRGGVAVGAQTNSNIYCYFSGMSIRHCVCIVVYTNTNIDAPDE